MMLFGLWHSTDTPDADRLLSSVMHELMVLCTGDLLIDVGDQGDEHVFTQVKEVSTNNSYHFKYFFIKKTVVKV